ncbi:MAG: helix-turn-helix domain-containing protein [Dehalococcoidia bacterium]
MRQEELQDVRKLFKLTQKEAASVCGVHWRTWQNWEYLRTTTPRKVLDQIVELFGRPRTHGSH